MVPVLGGRHDPRAGCVPWAGSASALLWGLRSSSPHSCPCPSPREPLAPSVGAEEVAPLLPRAPGPSCSGPRCKWLLVSVLCACSPASSGGCLVPGGTTFLPRALHTKNGIETGWPGCFLKFPFLLVAFCPRGPGGVQTVPWRLMRVCGVGEWCLGPRGGRGNPGCHGSLRPTGLMLPCPPQPRCQAPRVSPWPLGPGGHPFCPHERVVGPRV